MRRRSTPWPRAAGASSGLRDRAGDAAVAHLDDDRVLSGRPRRPRERAGSQRAHPVVAERLQKAGYRTAAFVSAFVLARRFGLREGSICTTTSCRRGRPNGSSKETTDRALADLHSSRHSRASSGFTTTTRTLPTRRPTVSQHVQGQPYLGEVAAMDQQLGRLVEAFERRATGPVAIVVAGDHGEGLGDHGESQHGNLLYQSTMHVPMVLVEPGVLTRRRSTGRSALDGSSIRFWIWRDRMATAACVVAGGVVLGEAMKPFLEYGWMPQVMAVDGPLKAILAGKLESYDVINDPAEKQNRAPDASFSPVSRGSCDDYPVPSPQPRARQRTSSDEERRSLASLGYVAATAPPIVRRDAPRPADMIASFRSDRTRIGAVRSGALRRGDSGAGEDSRRGSAQPRRRAATCCLALVARTRRPAVAAFRKAPADRSCTRPTFASILRCTTRVERTGSSGAAPLLEQVLAETPDRLPALEALAVIRERQGRAADAIALCQKTYALRSPTPAGVDSTGSARDERAADTAGHRVVREGARP